MYSCKNLYYLSTVACMLTECLSQAELEILAADLRTLGEMIDAALVRQAQCSQYHDPAD
ncbi:MAG: hypothetical protein K2N87_13675 [Eubacterium sp.]|nr:hypothetical protein [Eubacterium sp.]